MKNSKPTLTIYLSRCDCRPFNVETIW